MATDTEHAQALNDLAAQATKAKGEILAKLADLEAKLAASGNTTPEIDLAMQAVKDSVQGVDDIHPDAPVDPVDPSASKRR